MNNYIQPGNTLSFTAPAGGVVSGGAYKIGQQLVVAPAAAAAGASFSGSVVGVFSLSRATGAGTAWAEGDAVYWDDTAKVATLVAAGNLPIGRAAATTVDGDATGNVRLHGSTPAVFKSAEQTGTGASQDIAHGLGGVPSMVWVGLTEFADTLAVDVAEDTHDATNVKVTVTSGAKFKILAWA